MDVESAGPRPQLRFTGADGRRAIIVDAFHEDRWRRSGTLAPGAGIDAPVEIPFADLEPGEWRLQARTDPFGVGHAVVQTIRVGEAVDPSAGFDSALDELWVTPLPVPVRSRPEAEAVVEGRRAKVRWVAAFGVLLVGVAVVLLLLRRGFASNAQAEALLETAGDDSATNPRRLQKALTVVAIAAAVALAFIAVALSFVLRV